MKMLGQITWTAALALFLTMAAPASAAGSDQPIGWIRTGGATGTTKPITPRALQDDFGLQFTGGYNPSNQLERPATCAKPSGWLRIGGATGTTRPICRATPCD
ncbi:MAG TPA: hypothetical protein PLS90_09370 [Candidatus Sumerlaeota bacterium]|nr:hypothetical protein [Candidatus Sumerlaeota bacterium]HOR28524.1 hypothetical protein [Candidatus Sumerlaeota bacterium]HPK02654.1 hypothetical protein [Candidatus Sumerlaeota bacterium]